MDRLMLKELQEQFRHLLLEKNSPLDPPHPLSDWVENKLGLEVYWDAYFLRFSEVFEEDFPKVAARINEKFGEGVFRGLVMEYLKAHPPASPNLNLAGRGFADFLRRDSLGQRSPGLADLAHLEWLVVESFLSAALPAGDWHGMDADCLLVLAPSLRLLAPAQAVLHLWDTEQVAQYPEWLVVYRDSGGATVSRCDSLPFHILQGAQEEKTLGETLAEMDQVEASSLQTAMGELVRRGWVLGYKGKN